MISGLALVGVVGSAGAAFAGVAAHDTGTLAAQAEAPTDASGTAAQGGAGRHDRTIVYQVGTAGTVAVTVSGSTLTATNVTAGPGWSVVGAGGAAAHLEVQFTDTLQLVTFSADLAGDEVIVGVGNTPAVGATSTTATSAPITVTVVSTPRPASTPPAPQPATPTAPSVTPPTSAHDFDDDSDDRSDDDSDDRSDDSSHSSVPAPSATTAPSGGGSEVGDDDGDDHSDDHDGDDHGDHGDDHGEDGNREDD